MTAMITAAVMLMLMLSGCVSNAGMHERLSIDDAACRSYGLNPGEPAYVACRTQLETARTGRSCFGSCH